MKVFLKCQAKLAIILICFSPAIMASDPPMYKIKNVMGYCLDVVNGNAQLGYCDGRQTTGWFHGPTRHDEVMPEYSKIFGFPIRLCLDIKGAINENRTNVQSFKCNNTIAQQWKFTSRGEIRNKMGKCLDVAGAINKIGTNVQLFECNLSKAHLWKRRAW